MAWDGVERRKSFCPICVTRRAKHLDVTEGAGRKTIDYECEACGFQWKAEYDAITTQSADRVRRPQPLVLLVDDRHDSVDLFAGALGDGFNVTYAFDADTAFEIARVAHPDVVVIDAHLPGEDAWTLIDRLKGSESQAPIVVLSSEASSEMRGRAQEAGCAAFVTKPYAPADLAATLQQVL